MVSNISLASQVGQSIQPNQLAQLQSNRVGSVADTISDIQDMKNDEIALIYSKVTGKKERANATIIGAAFGVFEGAFFGATYAALKTFSKTWKRTKTHKIIYDYFIHKIDRFVNNTKWIKNIKNPMLRGLAGVALNTSWLVGTGALTGYAWNKYKTYNNTKVNGKISHTKQGRSADWLLSGLNSLSYTAQGKEIIKNSIHQNDDGTITVDMKGINKSYTISKDELNSASNKYLTKVDQNGNVKGYVKKYSKGDGDTLAFELAFEKYRKDLKNGQVSFNKDNPLYSQSLPKDNKDIMNLGDPKQVYFLLTGKRCCKINNENQKFDAKNPDILALYSKSHMDNFLRDYALNPNKYVATFDVSAGDKSKNKFIKLFDKNLDLQSNQTYAIKSINKKFVTVVDPKQSKNKIIVPISEFKKQVKSISYINLLEDNNNSELALKKYAEEV